MAVVRNKKDALILDFFAGSEYTLNAVNLLNAGGRRSASCIMVTNNECLATKGLRAKGFLPGDAEWKTKFANHNLAPLKIYNSYHRMMA